MRDDFGDLHSVLAHPESVILVEETSLDVVCIKAIGLAQCAVVLSEKDRETLAVTRFKSVERDWEEAGLPPRQCYVLVRGPFKAAWFAYVRQGHALPQFMQGRDDMKVVAKTWLHVHQTIENAVEYVADHNLKIPKRLADAPVQYRQAQMQLAFMLALMRKMQKEQIVTTEAHARGVTQMDFDAVRPLINKALAEARKHKSPMQLMPDIRRHNKKCRKNMQHAEPIALPQFATLMPARMRCDVILSDNGDMPRLEREWQRLAQRRRRAEQRCA